MNKMDYCEIGVNSNILLLKCVYLFSLLIDIFFGERVRIKESLYLFLITMLYFYLVC